MSVKGLSCAWSSYRLEDQVKGNWTVFFFGPFKTVRLSSKRPLQFTTQNFCFFKWTCCQPFVLRVSVRHGIFTLNSANAPGTLAIMHFGVSGHVAMHSGKSVMLEPDTRLVNLSGPVMVARFLCCVVIFFFFSLNECWWLRWYGDVRVRFICIAMVNCKQKKNANVEMIVCLRARCCLCLVFLCLFLCVVATVCNRKSYPACF